MLAIVLFSLLSFTSVDSTGPGQKDCVEVWRDTFSAPELEWQYGQAFVEVVVEHCVLWSNRGRDVKVWRRAFREFRDGEKLVEEGIFGWEKINDSHHILWPPKEEVKEEVEQDSWQ